MHEILALTLQSLQQDMTRVQGIAMNLSNAQTVGYKREMNMARPFSEFVQAGASPVSDTPQVAGKTMPAVDLQPATLRSTGQSLDLALEGEGWFEIQTANGLAYTRQGNFQLDALGRLVTAQGYPVMGTDGEIVLPTSALSIDATGNIFDTVAAGGSEPSRALTQLRIVLPDDAGSLQRLGAGMFAIDGSVTQMPDAAVQLRQGSLENSNVSAMREMTDLMQAMRHFESLQKVAHAVDDMLGTAIRKLGDV